jgi:hypothetical protein
MPLGEIEAPSRPGPAGASLSEETRQLLSRRISDLALAIPGTRLEPIIAQVYRELEAAGISLRPATYLSDEWGCPSGIPVIGIPFYLADPVLCAMEGQMTGVEAETAAETLIFLRHEVGHAFNYAYRLYDQSSWRTVFGRFSQPYREEYRPAPFSLRFVRHTSAWYAQKHSDDDFAETFGVWLDPSSSWRETYVGTAAMTKLVYVNQAAATYGRRPPEVNASKFDMPVQDMTMTLDGWYEKCREAYGVRAALPRPLDIDLRRLFPALRGRSAAAFLTGRKGTLVRDVNNWTGVDRHVVAGLVDEVIARIGALRLKTAGARDPAELARASVFVTTLAMNYLRYGRFVPE